MGLQHQRSKSWRCVLFGHSWRLGRPMPVTGTRFWECAYPRCHISGGTERQHWRRQPSRWLFTLWKGEAASVVAIYSGHT